MRHRLQEEILQTSEHVACTRASHLVPWEHPDPAQGAWLVLALNVLVGLLIWIKAIPGLWPEYTKIYNYFVLLGVVRSLEFSWFCCCWSDGNIPTQLGKNGLFMVEKIAQINPADLNLGETFTTKYFCKNIRLAGEKHGAFACTWQGDTSSSMERSSPSTGCPKCRQLPRDTRDIYLHLAQTRNLWERDIWLRHSNVDRGHRMAAETRRSSAGLHSSALLWWTSSIIGSKLNHFIVWRNFLRFSIQRPALVFQGDDTKIKDNDTHAHVLCTAAHGFPPAGHGHPSSLVPFAPCMVNWWDHSATSSETLQNHWTQIF